MSSRRQHIAIRTTFQSAVSSVTQPAAVLAYHLVGAGTGSVVDVARATFERHLDQLGDRIVPLRDVTTTGGVALTFDDAYANFADVVWPILKARNIPTTLFVPVAFVDGAPSPLRGAHLRACSWSTLRDLVHDGLDVGSHSMTHGDLRRTTSLDDELLGSRRRLEEELGVPVESFCWPRAQRGNEETARRAYRFVVTGGGTQVDPRMPWRLPRTSIKRTHADVRRIVHARVWLEEWVADQFRQIRP